MLKSGWQPRNEREERDMILFIGLIIVCLHLIALNVLDSFRFSEKTKIIASNILLFLFVLDVLMASLVIVWIAINLVHPLHPYE